MARHNFTYLYGRVTKNKITKDDNGNYLIGQTLLTVVRGKRNSEDDKMEDYIFDCPIIVSKNPDILYEMDKWKENDMVIVKGTVSTKDVKKTRICPNCGHKNSRDGVLLYITPIFAQKVSSCSTKELCFELLKKNCEISNQVIVAGNVCNDPESFKGNGPIQTQYQLAVNRKFRVKEDSPEIKTDYPWIKSYGENAKNDMAFINKGGSVLVEGYIQTREFKQTLVCEECGEEFLTDDQTLEITPYSTEYLIGCNSMEDIERMNAEQVEMAENILKGNA